MMRGERWAKAGTCNMAHSKPASITSKRCALHASIINTVCPHQNQHQSSQTHNNTRSNSNKHAGTSEEYISIPTANYFTPQNACGRVLTSFERGFTWICVLIKALPIKEARKNFQNGTRNCPHMMPARSKSGFGTCTHHHLLDKDH
jgi:hypothetical protein